MKKVILLLLILITVSISAKDIWCKTDALAIKTPDKAWSDWYPEVMDVVVNFEDQQIIVYSNTVQVLDYIDVIRINYKDYVYLKMSCTDSNYKLCITELYIYKSGNSYLKITYPDYIQYKYRMRES